ncbi:MAG: AMP-binding protein [Betaproteobacteria bacterium]
MNAAEQLLGTEALARHGGRVALLCGDEALSYRDLAIRVGRAAAALQALGIRPGDRVMLLMRDTPEFAAAWLGAVRAGAAAIALNTKLTEEDFRHIRADSGARLAIVEDVFAAARPDLAAEQAREGSLVVAGVNVPAGARDWRAEVARAEPAAACAAGPGAPAFWLYSSGTTGKPKGIVHTHASVMASGEALRLLGIGAGERVFATSKYFFAYGLEHGLLGTLSVGATGIALADWADPAAALAAVARHQPVAMFSVPSFYRHLLAEPAAALAPLRAIRHFVAAGERLPLPVIEQWQRAVGSQILSLYGNSEAYCACMMMPPGSESRGRTGQLLPLTEARLRDAAGAEPASGEPGVLWLRHPALAAGYVNRPEQTRAQFHDGWFCTQDLFLRDAEGFYIHQGRADELVKIAGQWVQPGELEETVAAEPSVAEVACVSVTDVEGFERLALFVTARGDEAGALEAAGLACEQRLPRFKRPKWIRSVAELPRTATGKVQRYKLREQLLRELAGKS